MFGLKETVKLITENSWMSVQMLFTGYLLVLSVMDIRWKKLHLLFLMSGLLLVAAGFFTDREIPFLLLTAGAGVGILFFIISRITRESFGYGDSILILIMGAFLGFWNILSLLLLAFSMAAIFSVILLTGKKFSRKSSFPFVPFLTAAYMGGMFFGYYQ